jgi:glycine oxidase
VTVQADAVLIGGGVMGCAIGWRLAQAGVDTIILERAIPGAEASSAAAGILAAQEEARGPGPLADLALRSRARFPELAAELRAATGVDIGHRECGLTAVCLEPGDEDRLEQRYAWQRAAGLRLEWLRGDALRAREPALAPAIATGLHFPDDGQVEPRAYLRALALAAAGAGARFMTGAHVRRVVHDGPRVAGVEVEGELVAARTVVVAAGSWSALVEGGDLPPRSVRPMRGQIAQLETRPPAIRGTIVCASGYVVGRADGRVLAGSTMELVGYEKQVTAGGLHHVLDVALRLAPGLASAPVTETWANFRPATDDELPFIGPTQHEGLLVATGHFRNGILLSPITADLIAELVVRGRTSLDLGPFLALRALHGRHPEGPVSD